MMHVRISLITAAPPVLAGCLAYLEGKVRPVVESQPGSLGLSLLAGQESGVGGNASSRSGPRTSTNWCGRPGGPRRWSAASWPGGSSGR